MAADVVGERVAGCDSGVPVPGPAARTRCPAPDPITLSRLAARPRPERQGWAIIEALRPREFIRAPAGRARRGARDHRRRFRTCVSSADSRARVVATPPVLPEVGRSPDRRAGPGSRIRCEPPTTGEGRLDPPFLPGQPPAAGIGGPSYRPPVRANWGSAFTAIHAIPPLEEPLRHLPMARVRVSHGQASGGRVRRDRSSPQPPDIGCDRGPQERGLVG